MSTANQSADETISALFVEAEEAFRELIRRYPHRPLNIWVDHEPDDRDYRKAGFGLTARIVVARNALMNDETVFSPGMVKTARDLIDGMVTEVTRYERSKELRKAELLAKLAALEDKV